MKKVFGIAAMLLALSACNKVETEIQPVPGEEGITITATLAPKGANTKAVADGGDKITVTWAVDEHIAVLYEVSSTKYVADATITAVDGSGAATITFTVEAGTANDTPCTLVYPLSAAKDDHSGVKDAATLLAAQDGTLNANLDVRVGAGTIQTTTPGLTVTTQPAAQFAIFKFTVKNSDASATINVKPLTVTIGAQDYVITPASATSELFVALPPIASQAVTFTATGSDSKTYTCSKASVSFDAGKYYQSTLKMAPPAPTYTMAAAATDSDKGKLICAHGHIHANGEDAECTAARVAKIIYVGTTGDATYSHGLALALEDVSSNTLSWNNSGYDNNSKTAAEWCSAWNTSKTVTGATWLLASKDQWNYMLGASGAGSYTALRDGFSGITGASNLTTDVYWSSTEYDSNKAWGYGFSSGDWYRSWKDMDFKVRACLAF